MVFVVGRGIPSSDYPMNGVFEVDQAKALKKNGLDVYYLGIDLRSIRRKRKLGIEQKNIEGLECYIISIPIGGVNSSIRVCFGRYAFSVLYRYVTNKVGIPEIIHAHFFHVAECVENVCKINNIPLVITEHSSYIHTFNDNEKQKLKRIYSSNIVKQIITVGNGLHDDILKYCGINTKIINNIVDLAVFDKIRNSKSHKPFRFVASGSLIYRKGYDLLLAAAQKLQNKGFDFCLTICGAGQEMASLKEQVKTKNLNTQVKFLGMVNREELCKRFVDSDCFVLPSRNETFGVVYIEAMSCGLPVIATKCGGPEYFINEEVGICIDLENIDQLAQAMETMIINHDQYNSKIIRKYALEHFSANIIADQIEEVYYRIISRGIY